MILKHSCVVGCSNPNITEKKNHFTCVLLVVLKGKSRNYGSSIYIIENVFS